MRVQFTIAGNVGGGGGKLGGLRHLDGPVGYAVLLAVDLRGRGP